MRFIFCLVAGLTYSGHLLAQQDYTKITDMLPPSPNAASLGKYGGLNVNFSSGTLNHSVPLYTYKSRDLSLPLSINYNTSGLKVDEIASRVGTGWSLNSGGVITRTVMGKDDLNSVRVQPPSTYPQRTRELIDMMENINLGVEGSGTVDGEADLFSFNFSGGSGRFVLDENQQIVKLDYSALKIERTSTGFAITNTEGVRYEFGNESEAVETSRTTTGSSCGKNYNAPVETSWYLSRIVHPNRDTISFAYTSLTYTYKAGTSESMYASDNSYSEGMCSGFFTSRPVMNNKKCQSYILTKVALLNEIKSSAGPKVTLNYISRADIGDRLVNNLEIYYAEIGVLFQRVNFNYTIASPSNRPFLSEVSFESGGNLVKHSFLYNGINSVPTYFSYSKDHYGYYNGKSNSTLIPAPSDLTWSQALTGANANRNFDPTYASKGALTKIIYPTGGSDSIYYEGNKVFVKDEILPPTVLKSVTSFSADMGPGTKDSTLFTISFEQQCNFYVSSGYEGAPERFDPIHNKGQYTLINTTTGNIVRTGFLVAGKSLYEIVTLQEGNYKLVVSSYGENTRSGAHLYCKIGAATNVYLNKLTGGIRIHKIVSSSGVGNNVVRKFIYNTAFNDTVSSAMEIVKSTYEQYFLAYVRCNDGTPTDPSNPIGFVNCDVRGYLFFSMHSNSLNDIYLFNGPPVNYRTVFESQGDNFENGGTEHKYTVQPNINGNSVLGRYILAAPLIDKSSFSGLETETNNFQVIGGEKRLVNSTLNSYKFDSRVADTIRSYIVSKWYSPTCQTTPPGEGEFNAYDLHENFHEVVWRYIDTVKSRTYDSDGINYVEQLQVFKYDNPTHGLATSTETFNSKGEKKEAKKYYVLDKVLTGAEETDRQTLIQKSIISPVLEQYDYLNGVQLNKYKIKYKAFPNGNVYQNEYHVQIGTGALEKRVDFTGFSDYGNLTEQAKAGDVQSSYIWDQNSTVVTAAVMGSPVTDISYTSFEADNKGGWSYSGTITNGTAPTGNRFYSLTASTLVSRSVTSGKKYTLSYWRNNAAAFAIVGGTVVTTSGPTINGWTFHSHLVATTGSTLSISGTGSLDEVRLYPEGAQMTTYTHDPLLGMTSSSDPTGNIVYYQYDALGRLEYVRDQNRNILKKYCYSYSGQQDMCFYNPSPIWQATGLTRCKPCPMNGTYNTDTLQNEERDINPQSPSYNSLRWTDGGVSGTCVINADWQNTATPLRCKKNGLNQNTGEQEQEQQDMNPCSSTYGQLRWIVTGTNTTACPLVQNIYAKITYSNIYNDGTTTTASYFIKFYSDVNCTVPITVSNLNVNYKRVRTNCGGSSPLTTNYSILCNGTQTSLGTLEMAVDDEIHCWDYSYSVTAGTGYLLCGQQP